jgi:hypothetical protein
MPATTSAGTPERRAFRAADGRRLFEDVAADDPARRVSGRVSVTRTRTVVDLPAPFGPSSPEDLASPHGEADPVERAHAPRIRLPEAFGDDRFHAPFES